MKIEANIRHKERVDKGKSKKRKIEVDRSQ
jgi:hypothetical protein